MTCRRESISAHRDAPRCSTRGTAPCVAFRPRHPTPQLPFPPHGRTHSRNAPTRPARPLIGSTRDPLRPPRPSPSNARAPASRVRSGVRSSRTPTATRNRPPRGARPASDWDARRTADATRRRTPAARSSVRSSGGAACTRAGSPASRACGHGSCARELSRGGRRRRRPGASAAGRRTTSRTRGRVRCVPGTASVGPWNRGVASPPPFGTGSLVPATRPVRTDSSNC